MSDLSGWMGVPSGIRGHAGPSLPPSRYTRMMEKGLLTSRAGGTRGDKP